jgi:ribosome biogenesis GTPase
LGQKLKGLQMKHKDTENIPRRWVGCNIEEDYFGDDRKLHKANRKQAAAKDRSKYKKTDRDKILKQSEAAEAGSTEHLIKGRVLTIASQGIIVDCNGEHLICTLRGSLKKEKNQFKNLVTVGDFVLVDKKSPTEGLVMQVEPRKTVLSRADNLSQRKEQLIAANIDQVLITVSISNPQMKASLVDRYIIATRKGGMEPVIIINKIDLLSDSEIEHKFYDAFLTAYESAKVPVIPISVVTGEGIDHLKEVMQGKASVFSGQSGVGKSSLINAITGLDIAVGHIVERTKKGTHTTTTANLITLPFGGWCVDTPGIKSFGLWDLDAGEVSAYFSEIFNIGLNCRFPSCTHMGEAGCAIEDAVKEGKISDLRYDSYKTLMTSITREHKRR